MDEMVEQVVVGMQTLDRTRAHTKRPKTWGAVEHRRADLVYEESQRVRELQLAALEAGDYWVLAPGQFFASSDSVQQLFAGKEFVTMAVVQSGLNRVQVTIFVDRSDKKLSDIQRELFSLLRKRE